MQQEQVSRVLYGLCKRVDSPFSLGLWLRYRDAPYEYAKASIDPLAYDNPHDFARDYQCLAFARKFEGLNTGIDKRKVALDGFAASERVCKETNERLRKFQTSDGVPSHIREIVSRMQLILENLVGRQPPERIFEGCRWGPGATASIKKTEAHTGTKMQFPIEVTPAARPLLVAQIRSDNLWMKYAGGLEEVSGPVCLATNGETRLTNASRLLTVPKDATKDRVIAAEPTGNLFLQLAVGGWLKKRLLYHGIDLRDQGHGKTSNRMLALQGSATGELATLDLRAASDTVAYEAVRLLFPLHFFSLLSVLRTPCTEVDGALVKLHKFSSMGNGYTFEVESAIFWAATKAATEYHGLKTPTGIYGDDIICHTRVATTLIEALEYLGFEVNTDKSFISGPFRESCGGHYFKGVDVTPFYQKRLVDNKLEYIRFQRRVYNITRNWIPECAAVADSLISDGPRILRNCVGPRSLEGEGFYYVDGFNPAKTCPRRGLRLSVAVARKPSRIPATELHYAYHLRTTLPQSLGLPTNPFVYIYPDGHVQCIETSDALATFAVSVDQFNERLEKFVYTQDPRSRNRGVATFLQSQKERFSRVQYRWVSLSFGWTP